MFVPGTKNKPEARIETKIAGITFACQYYEPSESAPTYALRFTDPIPYRFTEEEGKKPSNWLPPVFKKAWRGPAESRFVRLEYLDETKNETQLVFTYRYGSTSKSRIEHGFRDYFLATKAHLLEECGLSDQQRTATLEIITQPVEAAEPV